MFSRLLLVGVLAGASLGGLLGQQAPVPFDWASLAGSAIGSSPAALILAWQLVQANKEKAATREELRETNERAYTMAERQGSVLLDATRTLAQVQAGMEASIDRTTRPADDIARVLRRLETAIGEIRDGQR